MTPRSATRTLVDSGTQTCLQSASLIAGTSWQPHQDSRASLMTGLPCSKCKWRSTGSGTPLTYDTFVLPCVVTRRAGLSELTSSGMETTNSYRAVTRAVSLLAQNFPQEEFPLRVSYSAGALRTSSSSLSSSRERLLRSRIWARVPFSRMRAAAGITQREYRGKRATCHANV